MSERGPQGDHGQDGEDGNRGPAGPQGPAFSNWLTRNLVKAWIINILGTAATLVALGILNQAQTDRIAQFASSNCEANNAQTRAIAQSYAERNRQTQAADLERFFNIDTATADEFRRLSAKNTTDIIAALPLVDCGTGLPVPPPATTTTTRAP